MTTCWEYKTLQLPAKAKGECGEHPIGDRLRKLGTEGWELVAVGLLEDPLFSLYVFKRAAATLPASAEPLLPCAPSPQ